MVTIEPAHIRSTDQAEHVLAVNNITGVFQWKRHFFPAKKKPTVRRPKMS